MLSIYRMLHYFCYWFRSRYTLAVYWFCLTILQSWSWKFKYNIQSVSSTISYLSGRFVSDSDREFISYNFAFELIYLVTLFCISFHFNKKKLNWNLSIFSGINLFTSCCWFTILFHRYKSWKMCSIKCQKYLNYIVQI
jgi:hypothetical protein